MRQDPDPGEIRHRQFRHHTREHLVKVSQSGRLSRTLERSLFGIYYTIFREESIRCEVNDTFHVLA